MKLFFITYIVGFVLCSQIQAADSSEDKQGVVSIPFVIDAQPYLKSISKNVSAKMSIEPVWAPIMMDNIMIFIPAFKLVDTSTPSTLPAGVPAIAASTIQTYLDAINTARTQQQNCGVEGVKPAVAPVVWNEKLYAAAWQHSNDLAKTNTFSHTGSGTVTDIAAQALHPGTGSIPLERIEHNGYANWQTLGENLAAGTVMDQAQEAIDAWLGSDGHCANLMNPDFTEVGMAMVYDASSNYKHYWTQDFGKR